MLRPVSLAVAAVLAIACGCADTPTKPPVATSLVRLHVADVPVDVRVASRRDERHRGLGGVTALAPNEGMLFVYSKPGAKRFWMEDCLIPLDIAYLDDDGTVLLLDTLDPPARANGEVLRTRRSPPVRWVLEVRGGFFARHGLGEGTRVRLPASVDPERADP